jgi:hypothetical protein
MSSESTSRTLRWSAGPAPKQPRGAEVEARAGHHLLLRAERGEHHTRPAVELTRGLEQCADPGAVVVGSRPGRDPVEVRDHDRSQRTASGAEDEVAGGAAAWERHSLDYRLEPELGEPRADDPGRAALGRRSGHTRAERRQCPYRRVRPRPCRIDPRGGRGREESCDADAAGEARDHGRTVARAPSCVRA